LEVKRPQSMLEKKEKEVHSNNNKPMKKIYEAKGNFDKKSNCLINCLKVKLNPEQP
jgi:hypothetical protein